MGKGGGIYRKDPLEHLSFRQIFMKVGLFPNHGIVEKTVLESHFPRRCHSIEQRGGFEKLTVFSKQDIHWWATETTIATS